ncbi:MAG: transcription antitermination factor NusB [Actinobacteria bacterium]|nr:transcription antitermination factor NusB [Actinomycetota bacterium]
MSARHKARKRALDVLFQADLRDVDPLTVLADAQRLRSDEGDVPLNPYVAQLVEGVTSHRARIDELLSTYSLGWTLERMPGVDRSILRLGAYEVLWGDVPEAVALDEAVALARELSTDDSPAFVNGLLARIAGQRSTLDLEA